MRPTVFSATLFAAGLASRCAFAQTEAPVAHPPPQEPRAVEDRTTARPKPPATPWYGWQTLAVDAVAAAMFFGGYAADSRWVGRAGVGVFALGPPVVHGLHRRPLSAGLSLGARVGAIALQVAAPATASLLVTYPVVVIGDAALLSGPAGPSATARGRMLFVRGTF